MNRRRQAYIVALGFALLLTAPPCSVAQSKQLWSIYWVSDKLPCEGYWGKPMTAARMPCGPIGDLPISICPWPKRYPDYPYDQGKPITIRGFEIVQVLSSSTGNGYMAIGSAHGGDAADIFALTGGVGTNSKTAMFPADIGIPQGKRSDDRPQDYAHFDVYGHCDQGTQQALVNIFYTSP
jgi:hypothetical protein